MEGGKPHIRFFSELSDADQRTYETLRMYLAEPTNKNKRNKSVETFAANLNAIKNFVVRNDADDWKRAYVCGICWIGDTIAINTRNLRILVAKCKSSINGLFQAMGYGTVPQGSESGAAVVHYFPMLKDNFAEIRQWTVRKKMTSTPTPADLLRLYAPPEEKVPQVDKAFISPAPDLPDLNRQSFCDLTIGTDCGDRRVESGDMFDDFGFVPGLLDDSLF